MLSVEEFGEEFLQSLLIFRRVKVAFLTKGDLVCLGDSMEKVL